MRGTHGWWRHDRGSTAAEYALIVGLIALVAIAGIAILGDSVTSLFDSSAGSFTSATGG